MRITWCLYSDIHTSTALSGLIRQRGSCGSLTCPSTLWLVVNIAFVQFDLLKKGFMSLRSHYSSIHSICYSSAVGNLLLFIHSIHKPMSKRLNTVEYGQNSQLAADVMSTFWNALIPLQIRVAINLTNQSVMCTQRCIKSRAMNTQTSWMKVAKAHTLQFFEWDDVDVKMTSSHSYYTLIFLACFNYAFCKGAYWADNLLATYFASAVLVCWSYDGSHHLSIACHHLLAEL